MGLHLHLRSRFVAVGVLVTPELLVSSFPQDDTWTVMMRNNFPNYGADFSNSENRQGSNLRMRGVDLE